MDFAAWIEVYLGGAWHTFDPRSNVPRIGRVLVARGRDATDVAIATTFGPNTLESFKVWTDEIAESVPQAGVAASAGTAFSGFICCAADVAGAANTKTNITLISREIERRRIGNSVSACEERSRGI
ncbi:MAG: hypothetical protein ACLQFM_12105 [Terriglobales bacterium]